MPTASWSTQLQLTHRTVVVRPLHIRAGSAERRPVQRSESQGGANRAEGGAPVHRGNGAALWCAKGNDKDSYNSYNDDEERS